VRSKESKESNLPLTIFYLFFILKSKQKLTKMTVKNYKKMSNCPHKQNSVKHPDMLTCTPTLRSKGECRLDGKTIQDNLLTPLGMSDCLLRSLLLLVNLTLETHTSDCPTSLVINNNLAIVDDACISSTHMLKDSPCTNLDTLQKAPISLSQEITNTDYNLPQKAPFMHNQSSTKTREIDAHNNKHLTCDPSRLQLTRDYPIEAVT
jgi:hypothetical protein